ncbi:unnamed protein product [Paramecium pentaurelia]|uniref:Uncharacterized protein n=1 Tax=Paramecium pentaurelia TaxID=43138 RepID=A0A8S1XWI9_9CILI|nr:unnamed protein product [Paramecium pentaurelia]
MGNRQKNSYSQEQQKNNEQILKEGQKIEEGKIMQESNTIYEDYVWDCYNSRFLKTQFYINITSNQEIKYTNIEGSILRIDYIKDTSKKPEILTKLEQIKYLNWQGEYGENLKKVGKWTVTWKGEILENVGGWYSEKDNGQKVGLWKELIKNYWSKAQVYEIGEYQNGYRIGQWKYIYNNHQIGGGFYNESGQKIGKWIDINDNFWEQSYITLRGEYKNGIKVGFWNIYYNNNVGEQQTLLIGTGLFDDQERGTKVGKWIEMREGSWRRSLIILIGNYKNQEKVGLWDTYQFWDKNIIKIGGGNYDENGGNIKVGRWIELNDGFRSDYQVIFRGEYYCGNKVGSWDTQWRCDYISPFQQIGGGSYDEKGYGVKIGNWIEQSDNFRSEGQVITFEGDYRNGNKVGRWDYYWRENKLEKYMQIGGGSYDKQGNGEKIGKWIELSDNFFQNSKITYKGVYKNNKKVGSWNEIKIDDKKIRQFRNMYQILL